MAELKPEGLKPGGAVAPLAPEARPQPGDDFFCLRYSVWYPSLDCAVRTRFRTAQGCLNCEQGRFNLKRHQGQVVQSRLRYIACD